MSTILSSGTNVIIFIVMLGVLVFVHEFGHFFSAKRLRVPVFEFGFGFPPRLFRFWRDNGWIEIQGRRILIPRDFNLPEKLSVGSRVTYKTKTENHREVLTGLDLIDAESAGLALASPVQALDRGTEYTLNWIPIGGFVRLMGEEDPSVAGGFASAKPIVRAPILLAGVTLNLVLAFLVFAATAVWAPPYLPVQTTQITLVEQSSPAAQAGLRAGDIVATVNGQDVKGDYPRLSQLLRASAGKPTTLTVIRGKTTLAPITLTPRANPPKDQGPVGIALDATYGLRVWSVEPGSVADRAGVRGDDVLLFIVDPIKRRPLKDQNELAAFVQAHPGWKIEWTIARGGKTLDPIIVQIPQALDAQTATLGVRLQTSILDAPRASAEEIWRIVSSIPTMFSQMFQGSAPAVGVIGMAQATNEIAQRGGAVALLEFFGLLSLNLAVVNLLPFPGLDGGRLVFVLLEWARGGKKVDPQKEGLVHLLGFAVLLGLMVIISFFDVQRLVSGQSIFP